METWGKWRQKVGAVGKTLEVLKFYRGEKGTDNEVRRKGYNLSEVIRVEPYWERTEYWERMNHRAGESGQRPPSPGLEAHLTCMKMLIFQPLDDLCLSHEHPLLVPDYAILSLLGVGILTQLPRMPSLSFFLFATPPLWGELGTADLFYLSVHTNHLRWSLAAACPTGSQVRLIVHRPQEQPVLEGWSRSARL